MISLNHGDVRLIKDGAQNGGYFIENARTILKSTKMYCFFSFWDPIIPCDRKLENMIFIHFNALLAWLNIKFLCLCLKKGQAFVQF